MFIGADYIGFASTIPIAIIIIKMMSRGIMERINPASASLFPSTYILE